MLFWAQLLLALVSTLALTSGSISPLVGVALVGIVLLLIFGETALTGSSPLRLKEG
jgi:hypothetical protein